MNNICKGRVIMKIFSKIGKGINTVGGEIVKGGVNVTGSLIATKFPKAGEYVKEVGHTVVDSSKNVIKNVSQFADGTTNMAYGAITKNPAHLDDGWSDIKSSSTNTAKGIGNGLLYTGKSIGQTAKGAYYKDPEQLEQGLRNLGKVGVVTVFAVGVFDIIDADVVHAEEIDTRNASLDGTSHAVTGVEYAKNSVELENGSVAEGIFPIFDASFEATIPPDAYFMSDPVHIGIANMQLYEAIQADPGLADELGFTAEDVENLKSSVTPEGYDWHHHEEPGRIQLVTEEQHVGSGHTGGRSIWGGGIEAR